MNIALIAHDKKKELMVQFCIAYSGILSKHSLYATGTTGKMIIENTGLNVYRFLSGPQGGDQQIGARIAYNEIDLVLFFRDPLNAEGYEPDVFSLQDFAICIIFRLQRTVQRQKCLFTVLNAVTLIGVILSIQKTKKADIEKR